MVQNCIVIMMNGLKTTIKGLFNGRNGGYKIMVKTGIIRRFDDLGRIAVPKEVRKQVFGKTDLASVPMEFFYEKDGIIIMKPAKETDMN